LIDLTLQNNQYLESSRGILYSYLICLPLLILYEVLILLTQPDADYMIRISVDLWFKSLFSHLGLNAISATLYAAALFGAIIIYQKRKQLKYIKKKYFGYMLAESLIYAIFVSLFISVFLTFLLNLSGNAPITELSKPQLIALSLGAGLYEELFFRVILVSLLLYIFQKIFTSYNTSFIFAATIAALIFSGVHYIGEFGDFFTFSSFLFRFLFGLALNVIYVKRGFGIAAWTHAIYDLIVVINL